MSDSESFEPLEASLAHLVNDDKLKWVFVGGKGGVGKTTTSCSLAVRMAERRQGSDKQVLLISTDPAHNLSDAFEQKIGDQPTQIKDVANLFAMETDPQAFMKKNSQMATPGSEDAAAANPMAMLGDMMSSMPGIDEAFTFSELMRQVRSMEFDIVVFDTAPTGHTLRLLSLPETLGKSVDGILNMGGPLGSALKNVQQMMMPGTPDPTEHIEQMKKQVAEVHEVFKNAEMTTFVCVCIPEFLSVFETERLIQELAKFEIDCQNVVVNQVLYPASNSSCALCTARSNMQRKYLDQIDALYEDFHVVKMPLLHNEVRGVAAIKDFSANLLTPYNPDN